MSNRDLMSNGRFLTVANGRQVMSDVSDAQMRALIRGEVTDMIIDHYF